MNTLRSFFSAVLMLSVSLAWSDSGSVQRGAQWFREYCAGCHSLRYVYAEQLTLAIGQPLFGRGPIMANITPADATRWFGMVPPDLSLVATTRGTYWLNHYLTAFYPDKHRPFGANNRCLPQTAMPNMLAPVEKGQTTQQFVSTVSDVVAFLAYVAEPHKRLRYYIGIGVCLFICILTIVVYLLWRSYKNK